MKYIDREGNKIIKTGSQDKMLHWMYTHRSGRACIKLLIKPTISKTAGKFLDTKASKFLIPPFQKFMHISLDECEKQVFESYNDFFTRKIKKKFRPVANEPMDLISPCDGKLSVFRVSKERKFRIKQTEYSLESLLRSRKIAEYFQGGYACIFRLTVDDYHRYCYIDDGKKSNNIHIDGVFHTVNPAANDAYPIYKENTREYSLLKSRHFKTILMMEVGALLVGKIVNYDEACKVCRGQEKGKFEFGGSTIVLLFQENAIKLDPNLIKNTEMGYETMVKMGEQLGRAYDEDLMDV